MEDAHRNNWQVGIHANGDVTIDMVLQAYERVLKQWPHPDRRHRIEHCSLVNPSLIARIKAGKRSNGITIHPDGKRVYVSSGGDGTVQVIDVAANAIVATIPVGRRPCNMALTPDGRQPYVACGRSDAVAVVDTAENKKVAEIPVGSLPWGVVIR